MPKTDIIIAIKPEPEKGGRRKGAIGTEPRDDLGRRRKIKTTQKFLRIFDLGQYASGDDLEFAYVADYEIPALYTFSTGIDGRPGNIFVLDNPPVWATDYNSLMLAKPIETWPSLFKEITDTDPYHFSIENLGPYIPGKGREIPVEITSLRGDGNDDGIQWTIPTSEFFPVWLYDPPGVGGAAAYKVTMEPDYNSASATFIIDKSIDLFMTPLVYQGSGQAKNSGDPQPPFPYLPQDGKFVKGGVKALSRSELLNNSDWDAIYAKRGNFSHLMTSDELTFLHSYFINTSYGTQLNVDADLEDWVYPNFYIPLDKHSTTAPNFPRYEGISGWTTRVSIVAVGVNGHPLLGAARKHLSATEFEWYYFWVAGGPWGMPERNILIDFAL